MAIVRPVAVALPNRLAEGPAALRRGDEDRIEERGWVRGHRGAGQFRDRVSNGERVVHALLLIAERAVLLREHDLTDCDDERRSGDDRRDHRREQRIDRIARPDLLSSETGRTRPPR